MKKVMTAAVVTTAVGLATTLGIGVANAETTTSTSSSTSPMSGLVQKIADKFNLKESEVQAVFDENRAEMEQTREQSLLDKQAELVKSGKLSEAQSKAITAKRAELKQERMSNRQNNAEDRRANRDEHRAAIMAWLEGQDIDEQYAYLLFGGNGGHGGPRFDRPRS